MHRASSCSCWCSWLLVVLLQVSQTLQATSVSWQYAVIIDAGSTGSRVHVFRYHTASSSSKPPVVELPEQVHRTAPGFASYAFEPRTAANSLQPLLKFAKDKVPAKQVSSTPVQLLATAGLRLLGNDSTDAILTEVRRVLADSGFSVSATSSSSGASAVARVLSGRDEGLWGWLAVNYATGALQAASTQSAARKRSELLLGRKGAATVAASASPAAPLQGVLELGGASLQVTLLPGTSKPGQSPVAGKTSAAAAAAAGTTALGIPGVGTKQLFSRSLDGLGLQAAAVSWTKSLQISGTRHDPCLPHGYETAEGIMGTGNWGTCRAGVAKLLPVKAGCDAKVKCGLGMILPNMKGVTFIGLDNFYYTARALGLPTHKPISVDDIQSAAKTFCACSWAKLKAVHVRHGGAHESFISKVCFSSALIVGIMKDGLHIDESAPMLMASNSVTTPEGKTVDVNWALGALIAAATAAEHDTAAASSAAAHGHQLRSGQQQGISDAGAVGLAAGFCLLMIALTSCASYFRLGVSNDKTKVSADVAVLPGKYRKLRPVFPQLVTAELVASAHIMDGKSVGGKSNQIARQR